MCLTERRTVKRATKAASAISIEREELFNMRRKMQVIDTHLKKKGIYLLELEKEQTKGDLRFNAGLNGSARFINGKDEFGLPILINTASNGGESAGLPLQRSVHAMCLIRGLAR